MHLIANKVISLQGNSLVDLDASLNLKIGQKILVDGVQHTLLGVGTLPPNAHGATYRISGMVPKGARIERVNTTSI